MLSYFERKNRGAITIMLTILLLVVLSLNSTFLESARYISLGRTYKELEENAAFSLLSKYDRDLFKNYGLLAMDPSIGEEDLERYLNQNLNGALENANGIDLSLAFSGEDINIAKLYNLSEYEVYKSQINEFCALRAPINLLNDLTGFEDTIKKFIKELEDSLPMLNLFNKIARVGEKLTDYYIKMDEYNEASKNLYEMKEEYSSKVDAYNAAVNSYQDWKSKDTDEMTSEELSSYQQVLVSKKAEVESAAEAVRGTIPVVESALTKQYQKYEKMLEAQVKFLEADVKVMLSEAKLEVNKIEDSDQKESAQKMIKDMEKTYNDSKPFVQLINDARNFERKEDYDQTILNLDNQEEDLVGNAESLSEVSEVTVISNGFWSFFKDTFLNYMVILEKIIEGLGNSLRVLKEAVNALKIFATGGTFDPELCNTVEESLFNSLPGAGGKMQRVSNEYAASDEARVSAKIAETEEVAEAVNFNTNRLDNSDAGSEAAMLEECMDNVMESWGVLSEKIYAINTVTGVIHAISNILSTIWGLCVALANFIEDLIALVNAFTSNIVKKLLTVIVYQKLYPAIYAKEMFSNRTSKSSDKRMNASVFKKLPDGKGFRGANTEYIICGSNDEVANQVTTFTLMLMFRALCNIPALLSDQELAEIVTSLSATIVGILVAIVVVMVLIVLEAYADMIFILYGKDGVACIKTKGYFNLSGEGLEDLKKQAENLFKNTTQVIKEYDKKTDSGSDKKTDSDADKNDDVVSLKNDDVVSLKNDDVVSLKKDDVVSLKKDDGVSLKKDDGVSLKKDDSDSSKKDDSDSGKKDDSDSGKKKISDIKWDYKDHLFLLLVLFVSGEKMYARSANLIEMDLRYSKGEEYRLEEMATYLRVESEVEYSPLLPIPEIPGLNSSKLKISNLHYTGY